MSDNYRRLAEHLNRLPGGFPPTPNGLELKILKRLFTVDEAHVATALTMIPESVEVLAKRLQTAPDSILPRLDDMSAKGLIFKIDKTPPLFMAAQFVIGIWEYHVNDLDPELISDFNAYVPYLARQWAKQKTSQLRVVPVSKSLSARTKIMPYEAAEKIILAQSKIAVAPCICRKEHRMMGHGCGHPLEVCLVFGSGAYYYEKNGLGRPVDKDEALAILKRGEESGLVLQPGNAKKAMNICMCCGCCCQVLKNLKTLARPARCINSNYFAVADEQSCVGCGICEQRCHMEAVSVVEDVAKVDLDRCIGCGVCISACETGALSLEAKPAGQQQETPPTVHDTYMNIAKERGLI